MKTYLVIFRDKNTNSIKNKIKIEYDEKKVIQKSGSLCLAAIGKIKNNGEKIPKIKNTIWSYKVLT